MSNLTRSLTIRDFRRAARRTIETLEGGGYRCCVFGSLACSLWGMNRIPNDVDIVVFGRHDPEEIKAYIAANHHRFSLKNSRRVGATHKILYFNFHLGLDLWCKVDIVVAGRYSSKLRIPNIPQQYITYPNAHDIPVVPFLVLIILKVQGWRDHSKSREWYYRKKIPQDNKDIHALLDMADEDDQRDYDWWLKWFLKGAEGLVTRYTDNFPETAYSFRELGFDV